MRSSLRSGLIVCFAAVAVFAGCRDMVVPEQERPAPGVVFLTVIGLGSDPPMEGALVTLDNHAYASGPDAGEWHAETKSGVATFVGLPEGGYDINVQPVRPSSTPAWESTAVVIEGTPFVVAFEGVPFEVLLDWPELGHFGIVATDITVNFEYRLPRADGTDNTYGTSQQATSISEGRYAGFVPWGGRYAVNVKVTHGDFRLTYDIPDSVEANGSAPIVFASPLRRQPISLEAAGEPFTSDPVQIVHRSAEPYYFYGRQLAYDFEATGVADSVYLLTLAPSELRVEWVEGRSFLPQLRYLSEDQMAPGTIDLGTFLVNFIARDADGLPLSGAAIEIRSEGASQQWETGPDGELEALLHAGDYFVIVGRTGYEALNTVINVSGDESFVLQLEAE